VECPIARLAHTSTQVGSYLFVIGGHDGEDYTSEVKLFNLGTQQKTRPLQFYTDNRSIIHFLHV
jgi:hypothetical protein